MFCNETVTNFKEHFIYRKFLCPRPITNTFLYMALSNRHTSPFLHLTGSKPITNARDRVGLA